MTRANDDLRALLCEVRRRSAPPEPAPSLLPSGSETEVEWRTRVAAARAAADERAVRYRQVLDAAARDIFGHGVGDLLPPPSSGLQRSTIELHSGSTSTAARHLPRSRAVDTRSSTFTVRRTGPSDPAGRVVYLHGGGFWMGGGEVSENIDQALISHIASAANVEVLNLDYRLAPEHPYPASIVDVLGTIAWAGQDDLLPVGMIGVSSGANIAVAAARAHALIQGSSRLACLALIVPSVALSEAPPSLREDETVWAARLQLIEAYTGPVIPPTHPWISPAFAETLTGLPDTLVVTAAHDEVALGGRRLAAAIEAGGSRVITRRYPMTHTLAAPSVEAEMISEVALFVARSVRRGS